MAHILSELRNEIYDEANSIGDISSLGTKDGSMPYTLLLGVFVSLIPKVSYERKKVKKQVLIHLHLFKIVPKIMPSFIRNQEQRERFNDEEYQKEIEEVFVQRFVENLQVCLCFLSETYKKSNSIHVLNSAAAKPSLLLFPLCSQQAHTKGDQ